jgi:hypothetical protein
MIKKFNISKPTNYLKDGEEKTYWANVGTMTQFDNGQMIVEIPAIGLKASVFPQEDRNNEKRYKDIAPEEKTIEYPEEEINPDDIPY